MLNCIKEAYKKMEKEGLTPLEFNFPSFSIDTQQYRNIGMQILEDKLKIAVDSGEYNVVFNFDNIETMNDRIVKGIATPEEKQVFKKVETKLLKYIESDPNISRIEMSHGIINKICGDTMGVALANLSYYQGFKTPEPLSERQSLRMDTYDHGGIMNVYGSNEENKFVASLIMLRAQLPKAYRVASSALKSFANRATEVNQLQGFDLNNENDFKLATNIVNENKTIKNMVHKFQMYEDAPSVAIVEEIAKIDKKFAQEHYPLQMKKANVANIDKKNAFSM